MAGYEDMFAASLFDDDEDAGAASTTTKPVTETIVIEADEDSQPDASKKQKTDAAAGAAAAAGKQRIPRQLPAWAQPQPPKAAAKKKTRPPRLTRMDRASSARDFDPRTRMPGAEIGIPPRFPITHPGITHPGNRNTTPISYYASWHPISPHRCKARPMCYYCYRI
jgi:hypothetical protein